MSNVIALNTTTNNNQNMINDILARSEQVMSQVNSDDARRYISSLATMSFDADALRAALNEFVEISRHEPETAEQHIGEMQKFLNDLLEFDFPGILETAKQQDPISEDQYFAEIEERLIDMNHDPEMVKGLMVALRAAEEQHPQVFTSVVALMQADIINITFKWHDSF